jgi:hypothetical protein
VIGAQIGANTSLSALFLASCLRGVLGSLASRCLLSAVQALQPHPWAQGVMYLLQGLCLPLLRLYGLQEEHLEF